MNDPLPPIWIISSNEGTVLSAHCMDCKAGLTETYFHVTGVLFSIEAWPRLQRQLACTQMKCSWIIPSHVKKMPYAPISKINFKSARKLKQDLDHATNSNPSTATNTCIPPRATTHTMITQFLGFLQAILWWQIWTTEWWNLLLWVWCTLMQISDLEKQEYSLPLISFPQITLSIPILNYYKTAMKWN